MFTSSKMLYLEYLWMESTTFSPRRWSEICADAGSAKPSVVRSATVRRRLFRMYHCFFNVTPEQRGCQGPAGPPASHHPPRGRLRRLRRTASASAMGGGVIGGLGSETGNCQHSQANQGELARTVSVQLAPMQA